MTTTTSGASARRLIDSRRAGALAIVLLATLTAPAPAANQTVGVINTAYQPATVTIALGEKVTWNWISGLHSVTANPGQTETFNSGEKSSGTFSHTFTHAGTFRYYCSTHSTPTGTKQNGTVVVTQATSGGNTGSTGGTGGTLTLGPVRQRVTFGVLPKLSGSFAGQPPGGVAVRLAAQPHPFTALFAPVASLVTDAAGSYSAFVTPDRTTRYSAVVASNPLSVSPAVTVSVRPRITLRVSDLTPRHGQRVRFSGTISPSHTGKRVILERRGADRRYHEIARLALRRTSATRAVYSTRLRVNRSGTYRARFRPDSDHVAASSPRRRLRAT